MFGPGNHRTKYQTPNTKLQTACGDLEGGYDAGADGGGVAAVRPPPLFSQAAAAAAGLFGGKFWPLQGRLAASFAAAGLLGGQFWPLQGRCKAVTLTPLLMVLLLWNMPSAIFKFNVVAAVNCSLCYLQVSPFLF